MKNFLKFVVLFISTQLVLPSWTETGFANEPLRAEESLPIVAGKVVETGILTDDKGTVFLEFIKDTYISNSEDKQPFEGEILPPQIIDIPTKKPRGRMTEILSFELLVDSNTDVTFVNKFSLLRPKQIIRLEHTDPNAFERTEGVRVFHQIKEEDQIGLPTLWQYLGEDEEGEDQWIRIGGKIENTKESDVKIFSAVITTTGIFSLLDENPSPILSENTPTDLVELVEDSPYPSVETPEPEGEVDYESSEFPIEDTTYEDSEEITDSPFLIPASTEESHAPTQILDQEDETNMPELEEEVFSDTDEIIEKPLPEESILPQSGPAEKTKKSFPFTILLAVFILGTSIYFGLSKKY
ncbi:hypothetical protein KAI58_00570 [Candidatus Gracilibacteria bacterium]|nr:hypothetical protein [Candidatus Gracilibacteria bacterium]